MKQAIFILDGIAIILIVLSHSYYPIFQKYLAPVGLVMFTFSSGLKLGFNHKSDFGEQGFIRDYALKRFKRLYKPYIVYTIITTFILLAISTSAHSTIEGFYQFRQLSTSSCSHILYQILIGRPLGASHMWYLTALLVITLTTLIIIYLFNMRILFLLCVPIFLSSWLFPDSSVLRYLPIFIIGLFVGCRHFNIPTIFRYAEIPIQEIIINSLTYCGKNSFYIYLFQGPFVQPLIYLLLTQFMHFPTSNVITSLISAIITIFISIRVYYMTKLIRIDWLFW
jgi:hypothetical protein